MDLSVACASEDRLAVACAPEDWLGEFPPLGLITCKSGEIATEEPCAFPGESWMVIISTDLELLGAA